MARKRRKRRQQQEAFPGWVWMLFGLGIGLSVALVFYLQMNAPPQTQAARPAQAPAQVARTPEPSPAVDNNGETGAVEEPPEQRFDFYKMLPNYEVVIPEQEAEVTPDVEPRAVEKPGIYVLQAGSFSRYEDADRRRAELAMQGIESVIQRVAIDDRTYHRVRIGPIDDLEELNVLRSRLRAAKIDVLRIRLGDQ